MIRLVLLDFAVYHNRNFVEYSHLFAQVLFGGLGFIVNCTFMKHVLESLAGISSMHPAQPAVSTNPENWTTDEVLQYIRSNDPTLSKQAHLIQSNVRKLLMSLCRL